MNGLRERVPSLDVFHPIVNIGKPEVSGLSRALIGDEGAFRDGRTESSKRAAVQRLLGPARLLRAEVIIHSELLRLYEDAGIHGITEEHVDELSEYLEGVLPKSSRTEVVDEPPTLPSSVRELGGGLVLSIAGSQEMMQERILAKAAILNFYRLKHQHKRAWFNDEQVTGAWLARSSGPTSNMLLRRLEAQLEQQPELLPEHAHIGGIVLRPNPHRHNQ